MRQGRRICARSSAAQYSFSFLPFQSGESVTDFRVLLGPATQVHVRAGTPDIHMQSTSTGLPGHDCSRCASRRRGALAVLPALPSSFLRRLSAATSSLPSLPSSPTIARHCPLLLFSSPRGPVPEYLQRRCRAWPRKPEQTAKRQAVCGCMHIACTISRGQALCGSGTTTATP